MARVTREIRVEVEVLTHDVGHWCRACALPSGVRAYLIVRSGVAGAEDPMRLQQGVRCAECGGDDIEIAD